MRYQPRAAEPRKSRIQIKVSDVQKREIKRKADAAGLTISAFLVSLALG